ncbi:MAG TPA: class I SAM-dependent methyltransferase [Candidatus Tumulicola sp.]|nr:class I SAM-dependent methyltransferase [Candidatus Tumulicola sp.]
MNASLARFFRALPSPVQGFIRSLIEIWPGVLTYHQDGLATRHSSDFLAEARFRRAYAAGAATKSWGEVDVQWRAYVCCWAASHAARLEGDFVECGVNRGANARAIVDYLDFARLPKTFYLLDLFADSDPSGSGDDLYEDVIRTFRDFPNVRLVRGRIPGTLPMVTPAKVCFLAIDMNDAGPEIAAAEHFWDILVPGAIIVLDDYGDRLFWRQKVAFDHFAQRVGVEVLSLPTGQGLILKPG